MKKNENSYKKSGVNISLANKLVDHISKISKKDVQKRKGFTKEDVIGGFGSLFDISNIKIKDPVIVSCTDGVGTKVDLANKYKKFDTVGIDLVAMCVNDLIVQGAKPLFFLDYIAVGKLDLVKTKKILKGIFKGCKISKCKLIGGETAEMPGIYKNADFDLAGFAVGAFERGDHLPTRISNGDLILGLPSSGIHSNGFSLVRKIVEISGLNLQSPCPFSEKTLGTELLTPTEIYVKSCLEAVKTGHVVALAHITGGGLTENIIRILEPGQGLEIDLNSWPLPPVFNWLAAVGSVDPKEMLKTFNCGIGMVLIVPAKSKNLVKQLLEGFYDQIFEIGIINDSNRVSFSGELL